MEAGWWPLSPWISPGVAWFIFLNVVVGAIVVMSRAQGRGGQPQMPTRRRALARGVSSVVVDRLRSFSIFSSNAIEYSCTSPLYPVPDRTSQETQTEEPLENTTTSKSPHAPTPAPAAAATLSAEQEDEENRSISMEEAYALARRGRAPPQPAAAVAAPRKAARPGRRHGGLEEAGKEEVNARAEDFIREFREDLKLQRLNSIFNYTQTLKGRERPART